MYEMQGPRLVGQCKLVDCPDELESLGQSAFLCSVRPANELDAQENSGYPVIPCPLKLPKVSLIPLRATPVSLVRDFYSPAPSEHKTF